MIRTLKWKHLFLVLVALPVIVLIGARVRFDRHLYRNGYTFMVKADQPDGYDYLLRIPKGYHDFSGKRPLLVFLHGAGEVGGDLSSLLDKDPYHYAHDSFSGEVFPFVVVTPVSEKQNWDPDRIMRMIEGLLESKKTRFRLDRHRIYLTGYSMGGFGTLETAMEYPDVFAAIAPVAGGGEPSRAWKLKKLPIWNFHGENDPTVPRPSSQWLMDAVRKEGNPHLRETIIPGQGHAIAGDVYSQKELYQWFLGFETAKSE